MRHIRPALTEDMAGTIACALVGACLDYAISVLVGVTTKNVACLQHAQNAIAPVVAWGTSRQSSSSSALLKHYHWLPIHQRIQFKITCITYRTINTTQPAYMNSVLEHYTPSRTLRSSDTNLLSVPRVHTCFGSKSFSVAAPTIWNSFSFVIRNSCSIASFHRQLKTFLFSTFSHHPSTSDQQVYCRQCAFYKFTYLLTYFWRS